MLDRRASLATLAAVGLLLAAYVVYPALRTFEIGLNLERLSSLFGSWSSANVRALKNSVFISVYSVLGAGVLGTGLAYLFFRVSIPFRRTLSALAVLPLALPPLVGVLAFLFLYGESGILPRFLQSVFALESVPFSFDGLWAVWVVHVYTMYVYFYLFASAGLRRIDRSVFEASADLGASEFRTFLSVIGPQLRPSLTGASLLVFMLSMASFTAPLLFAGTEHFMTLQIYNYKTNGDLDLSAAVSTVLTLICLVFLIVMVSGNRSRGGGWTGKGVAPVPATSGGLAAKSTVFVICVAFVVFLLAPVATIVLVSFASEGGWTHQIVPSSYTLRNYVDLLAEPNVLAPIRNSVLMAGVATVANTIFGVVAGLYIVKSRGPLRPMIRLACALPFAIPGTVIAVNLILSFNEPSILTGGIILVGTFWMLPLAYFVRQIPITVGAAVSSLERYDDRLSEASFDLGASTARTIWHIVLPSMVPAIVAGSLLTFVASLGEFVSSIMLYVYDNRPISVEILSQLRIYDFGAAAAYSVFLMVLVVAATLLVRLFGRSNGEGMTVY